MPTTFFKISENEFRKRRQRIASNFNKIFKLNEEKITIAGPTTTGNSGQMQFTVKPHVRTSLANDFFCPDSDDKLGANYKEMWDRVETKREPIYILKQLSFKLLFIEENQPKEIISFHIENPVKSDSGNNKFKNCPHFHIDGRRLFKKAHISVALSVDAEIFEDYVKFNTFVENYFDLIKNEILPNINLKIL